MNLPKKATTRLTRELEEARSRIAELEKELSAHSNAPAGPGGGHVRPLHYEELFLSFPLGLTITDEQGRILATNREAERLLGISPDEHEKRTITGREWQGIRPDGTPMPPEEFPAVRALKERRHIENVSMGIGKGTGDVQWINVTAAPIPLPGYGVAVVYGDFSRGRKVEEALRISEERYQQLFEDDLTGNFIARPDGRILMCNPSFVRIFGFSSREEALASSISELHLSPGGYAGFIALLKEQGELKDYEDQRRRHDGSVIHVVENAVGRFDEQGELVEYQAYIFDDTERKRMEEELRDSEERFRIMADSSPLMIWVVDETGTVRFVNSRYCEYFGISAEEVTESSRRMSVHPEDRDSYMEDFRDAVREKRQFHSVARMLRADGRWKWLESFGNPRFSPEGDFLGLVCSGTDITESVQAREGLLRYRDRLEELVKERTNELEERNRKLAREIAERRKAEEARNEALSQLMHLQKIEALGRFAGGIAHDLNNMLYPIILDAESMLEELPPDEPPHQTLGHILQAAYRQRDLVKQILSFSRRSDQQLSPIRIAPLIRETATFLRSSLPSTIEIRLAIKTSNDWIMADPTQIQQVIMNLCRNAADSLPSDRGIMEIGLANVHLGPTKAQPGTKAGEYLELSVKDTGEGMAPDTMSRIFEPFYTTKEIGKGIGMGLSITHGIVRGHKGMITVESDPGKGSRFAVYFPVSTTEETAACGARSGKARQAKGRILLVDDDRMVLSSVSKALRRLGYEVIAAGGGSEALAKFSEEPDAFSLVMTDLTMPQMNGLDLAGKMREIRPHVPVIVCTGFNEVIDEHQARARGITGVIFKPAGTGELSKAVDRAIHGC